MGSRYYYKRAIIGLPAKRHLNGVKWPFCWRADAAGLSLNARMITVIFQEIRTRIAEKLYIFVIFRGGGGGVGGVWIRGCPVAANLLY